jgi:hypothetical protein
MIKINKDTKILWKEAQKKTYESIVCEINTGKVVLHTVDGVVDGNAGDFIVKDINNDNFIITKENIKHNYENFKINGIDKNKDISNIIYKSDDFSIKHFIATRIPTKIKYVCIYEDFELETTNGTMYGKAFDYIMKTPKTGYLYRIDADIFSKTYVVNLDYNDKISELSKFKGMDIDYIINTMLVRKPEFFDEFSVVGLSDRVSMFMNTLIKHYRDVVNNQKYPIYEDWSFHEADVEQELVLDMIDELRDIILEYYTDVIYC